MNRSSEGDPQGFVDPEDQDTIELQLTAEQMLALTRAAVVSGAVPEPPAKEEPLVIKVPPRPVVHHIPRLGRMKLAVGTVAATLAVSIVSYLSTATWNEPAALAAEPAREVQGSPPQLVTPVAEAVPVRFTNPFDATEVFEFPPGTTDTEAHDAVAALLLERARERQSLPRVKQTTARTEKQPATIVATARDPRG